MLKVAYQGFTQFYKSKARLEKRNVVLGENEYALFSINVTKLLIISRLFPNYHRPCNDHRGNG